ncbi:MAG: Rieske 2Fe-2S domain-containing protein [Streptosporangiales bacterium]|nr:Rieske 2Fe-2S domain-containing protein [Streptosporangiales bacterium]
MPDPDQGRPEEHATSRRRLMTGAGAVGVGVLGAAALAACGTGDEGAGTAGPGASTGPSGTPSQAPPSSPPAAEGALAKVADVPVGGGKVIKDQQIVVTQPEEGTFKAFATVCTHKGCDVDRVEDGTVFCPCHGSAFSAADGSVERGPAKRPLSEQAVKVEGDSIVKA